jgi:hypothetical protein
MRPTSIGTSSLTFSANSSAGGVENPTQFV